MMMTLCWWSLFYLFLFIGCPTGDKEKFSGRRIYEPSSSSQMRGTEKTVPHGPWADAQVKSLYSYWVLKVVYLIPLRNVHWIGIHLTLGSCWSKSPVMWSPSQLQIKTIKVPSQRRWLQPQCVSLSLHTPQGHIKTIKVPSQTKVASASVCVTVSTHTPGTLSPLNIVWSHAICKYRSWKQWFPHKNRTGWL